MALESIMSGKPGSPSGPGESQIGLGFASLGDMHRLNQIGSLPAAFANTAKIVGGSAPLAGFKQVAGEFIDTQIQFTTVGAFIEEQINQGLSLEEIQEKLESAVRGPRQDGTSNITKRGFDGFQGP